MAVYSLQRTMQAFGLTLTSMWQCCSLACARSDLHMGALSSPFAAVWQRAIRGAWDATP